MSISTFLNRARNGDEEPAASGERNASGHLETMSPKQEAEGGSSMVTHLAVGDALLSREPDWELIAESIPHIAWVKTPDGAAEYLNKMGAEFFGLGAEETYGWSWLSLVHPDDAAIARPTWERAIREKAPYHADYRMRGSDGQYHWMASRGLPVKAQDGTILRWLGTLTEIDENKRLEDELRRAERQAAESLTLLETLQSKAPVGFGFVDRDFRFVRVNQTLAAINGVPLREHWGRRVAQVVPSLWPQIEPLYRRVLSTGEPVVNFELTGETAIDPGVLHNWLASFYPVRIGTEIIGIGVVVIDITERTRAEEFRSVVMDNMGEGLYVLDKDGLLTYMNRAASRMLGWDRRGASGKAYARRCSLPACRWHAGSGERMSLDQCPNRGRGAAGGRRHVHSKGRLDDSRGVLIRAAPHRGERRGRGDRVPRYHRREAAGGGDATGAGRAQLGGEDQGCPR